MGAATQVGWVSIADRGRRRSPGAGLVAPRHKPDRSTRRADRCICRYARARCSTVSWSRSLSAAGARSRISRWSAGPSCAATLPRPSICGSSALTCWRWPVRISAAGHGGSVISGWPRRCPPAVWCNRSSTQPATPAVHVAIVELGFEGTVLKRPSSLYRPGRHGVWRKHKARHTVEGVLLAVRQDRDGHWHGVCDVGGRRVVAHAGASSLITSASSSAWSTRGSTPTVTCARSVSLPVSAPAQPHEQPTYLSRCPGLAARQ